ncbi:tetratricopeptide repeat protein [Planctomyces sp. SH-PL62]|uniref:tetratricopeptide repeat protein n=1 Tax=Planctomyces sp. SH-PL62 TaxID=1636152 RepID=UPI00078E8328|nr:tetratricopeptide repeat protein [Planctomyces sp. SH-PL62]AMV39183.1 Tetratricopeptide repeat protein [Planctomyces sp. SH-PL62]
MTRPDASSPVPDKKRHHDDADPRPEAVDAAEPPDAEPEPEPWTPERVSEWNAYYDLYVLGAVLLLAFAASCIRTNHSPLWANLKMGREILARGTPVMADAFSYTEQGRSWVNIPWLFQAAGAGLYNVAYGLVPEAPDDPTANRASAEQIATGALVALTALARLLTAYLLLRVRHRGPGLWWTAVCTALALGAIIGPAGLMLGGVAQPAVVGPSTWGVLFLAFETLWLFRAFVQKKAGALYALVPLFLVWANVDDSFLFGLLILGAAVLGKFLDGRRSVENAPVGRRPVDDEEERAPVSTGLAASILLACAVVVLANPSHVKIYPAALEPVTSFFSGGEPPTTFDQLSYFGKTIRTQYPAGWHWLTLYYLVVVSLAAATFVLNAARFSWARFLPFAFAAFAWAVYMRYSAEFAVVAAAVAALNGQEWYQRRFGVEGKLGTGWAVWSTGGRLVTLASLFLCVSISITGYGKSPGDPRFGFGFDPNDFAFEAAEYLAAHDDIKGNVFNWTPSQGDALLWKAGATRKTFVDNRSRLFPDSILEEHRTLLNALRDDDPEIWKPIFDKYGVSTVMLDSATATNTYRRLTQSPNWIPFYDDGRVVMFGRADAAEPDLATFRANRLDPDLRAYKVTSPTPAADRPPTPVNWIDDVFQSRALTPPRTRNNAARRWLTTGVDSDGAPVPPDPARCLLAIREARTALSLNPDDTTAYRLLVLAYRGLAQQEAALIGGVELTPENRERIAAIKPGGALMSDRLRQIVTSLNYAIQTTPPPATPDERRELMSLQFELFETYLQLGFIDLARDQLRAFLDAAKPGELEPQVRSVYANQLDTLNRQMEQISQTLGTLQIERQAGPIELGQFAMSQGAAGLAIIQFEDAERGNMSPMIVKPQLLDLYCGTGQPDRALELLSAAGVDDASLGDPGLATFRQGLVYKLLGNYASAASLWQGRSIPRLAYDRSTKAIGIATRMLHGDLVGAANDGMSAPSLLGREADWEFDLAQCLLESGEPERAAEHYTKALELTPESAVRPLIAYYLEKIGKPVPPKPEPAQAPAAEAAKPAATPSEEPKAEAPKAEEPKAEAPKAEEPKAEAPGPEGAGKP